MIVRVLSDTRNLNLEKFLSNIVSAIAHHNIDHSNEYQRFFLTFAALALRAFRFIDGLR